MEPIILVDLHCNSANVLEDSVGVGVVSYDAMTVAVRWIVHGDCTFLQDLYKTDFIETIYGLGGDVGDA